LAKHLEPVKGWPSLSYHLLTYFYLLLNCSFAIALDVAHWVSIIKISH